MEVWARQLLLLRRSAPSSLTVKGSTRMSTTTIAVYANAQAGCGFRTPVLSVDIECRRTTYVRPMLFLLSGLAALNRHLHKELQGRFILKCRTPALVKFDVLLTKVSPVCVCVGSELLQSSCSYAVVLFLLSNPGVCLGKTDSPLESILYRFHSFTLPIDHNGLTYPQNQFSTDSSARGTLLA